jgi:hypothetical protein
MTPPATAWKIKPNSQRNPLKSQRWTASQAGRAPPRRRPRSLTEQDRQAASGLIARVFARLSETALPAEMGKK